MPKYLKQFLAFIREILGIGSDQSHSDRNYNLNLFNGTSRLAQSPNAPRPTRNGTLDHYSNHGAATKRHKYSPEEVKRILRGIERGEHAQAVLLQAATFSSLLDERMIRHFRGRERLFERLPYVLFQYTQGRPSQEIARSVSFFSDGEDVEEAMDFASRLIAHQVNRQRY